MRIKEIISEEAKVMSRAAKGMMKYGKEGMKELAKDGKEGKDLEPIRQKYDRYDEAANAAQQAAIAINMKKQGKKPKDEVDEVKQRLDAKCWTGKHKEGTKIKGGVRVNNCVPNESVEEGWKSKLAGAAMVGLGALGAAGHAKADDQSAGAKAPTQTSQSAGGLQWLDDPTVPDNLPGKVAGSRFPTRAPVGTKYGSFMNDKGEKINAYVDSDLTSRFVPDKEGEWKPQKFPTNAKVGTKYSSFTNSKGELIDKYVDHDLTTRFQKASDGPWKPR
jgi:hypothetical protein